ncbi:hypothetical protein A4D02_24730 [Niastella koreensis]|uniref:Uncharacterized protein n=2 Tax=Niastella koreensis TaxID=354356 RepID=G8TFU0_NIAKG|nr:hypothetical protein Niako_4268 [Niastella koreensis GR20-10]OQP52397.1 hypothetical protein A4D02_24730 [Niastella koreensis]
MDDNRKGMDSFQVSIEKKRLTMPVFLNEGRLFKLLKLPPLQIQILPLTEYLFLKAYTTWP